MMIVDGRVVADVGWRIDIEIEWSIRCNPLVTDSVCQK
jgi:hypothetical protein